MTSPGYPQPRVALVLPSVMASGTERRLSFVYRHLQRRFPGEYMLVVSGDLYAVLNRGGFGLDRLPGVHVLGRRSPFDRKTGAHAAPWVDAGRLMTLHRYRKELIRLIREQGVRLLHPYLEMVPFLALRPIRGVPWIVPMVDHLPKYFDGRSRDSRLLLRAISYAERVDCLFRLQSEKLEGLGVERRRLNNPAWNCVNHEAFHPEPKDLSVSYAARAIDWKNPLLMVDVIDFVMSRRPNVRFSVVGQGKLQGHLAQLIERKRWKDRVRIGYLEDPSPVVNRSLIHVSLDRYDNSSNQSMLEGMASGCAIVASDVGETYRVVTEDVGVLTALDAEDIGQAILQLLDDPARAQELGRQGRQRVLENHNVDRYIDYLRLIHDLSAEGRVVDGVRVPPAE